MLRVLIVDDAPLTLTNIERLLASADGMESCGTAQDGATALRLVDQTHPDVVLMDMDLQHSEGLRTAQEMTTRWPHVAVIIMGLDDDEGTRQMVAKAGARHYLVKPFGGGELLSVLRQMGGMSQLPPPPPAPPPTAAPGYAASAVPLVGGTVMPAGAPVSSSGLRPPSTASQPPPESRVIALISGKGGVGTSVITTNLALLSASEANRKVAIIDFDLQHGDIRRMLRVDAPEGIIDLARVSPNLDRREALVGRMAAGPNGIQVLLSPPRPSLEADLSPEFVASLLLQMRFLVQDILIDMSPHITPASVAALRSADNVVLVSSMSDPGVRATQGMLRLFADIGVPAQKVTVILNRTEANSDLTKPAVEEALRMAVPVQLPYDPILVSTSINRGAPFVLHKPDAQASRKLREVAALLFPMPGASEAPAPVAPPSPSPSGTSGAAALYDDDEPRRKKKGIFGRK